MMTRIYRCIYFTTLQIVNLQKICGSTLRIPLSQNDSGTYFVRFTRDLKVLNGCRPTARVSGGGAGVENAQKCRRIPIVHCTLC